MTRISAPGMFNELTISKATDDLPEPELPAIPMMLISAHGGQAVFEFAPGIIDELPYLKGTQEED